MSVVTDQLRRLVRDRPVDEKVLVSAVWEPPQTAVTLRDRLALEGVPSAALLDWSVEELARDAAEADLAVAGRRPLSSIVRLFLVRDLVRDVLLRDGGYFSDLPLSPGVCRSVVSALRELRLAGVDAEGLVPGRFVSEEKGRAVRRLLGAYEDRLSDGGWLDEAGLLRAALEGVDEGRARRFAVLAVPGDLRLSPLEARFLEAHPADRKLLLGWTGDRGVDPGPDRARRRLDGFERAPASDDDPTPHRAGLLFRTDPSPEEADGELTTAVALGAENEVRSVFRSLTAGGLGADRVEVAYTDAGRYRPLLLSDAERFGVRCTFAEGLPVDLTRAGRALRLLYEWVLEDFDDRVLRRVLRSGLVDFREAGLDLELLPSQAAALLRDAKVGRGRARYGAALRRLRGRVADRLARRRSEGRPAETLQRRLRRIEELARLADPDEGLLWDFVPPAGAEEARVAEVARRSRAFLDRLVAPGGRLEPPALESLDARLREVEREVEHRMAPREAVRALRDEIESHPVSRSGPQPGALHAAPLEAAGHSGRERLFVVGLDEGAFPGRDLEDPLLLDRERRALSAGLPLRRRGSSDRLRDLSGALGRAAGEVTVFSSVRDVADDRELYPSSAFLRAHRVARDAPDLGFEACLEQLRPPVSFTADPGRAAAPYEAWLGRADRGSPAYRRAVGDRHPGVRRGREAERRRASAEFTAYDGRVEAEPDALDPRRSGEVVSPSRLETLVESPFRYFLRYVLELEPVEELEREPGRWLDPLERGRLLHELFRDVMAEVAAAGERPDAERHRPVVEEVADRLLAEARERVPPPTEAVYRREAREIRRTAEIFLRDEADRADEAEPWAFEVRFGHDGADGARRLESSDPVELELDEAGPLRVRGSIDRVDRMRPGVFRVWDYKTGSTSGHDRVDPLGEGRLQWLVYALALEELLGRDGTSGDVRRSGYLFPGDRAHGERMEYAVDDRAVARLDDVLARRLDLVAAGLFPHAAEADACRWCDFRRVCGDPERRAREVARKAGAGDAGRVAELLERWRDG